MSIEIGQMYKDPYPINGRIRRFVVTDTDFFARAYLGADIVQVAVLEPRKRKPSKHVWFKESRFNGPHARGLVRVK